MQTLQYTKDKQTFQKGNIFSNLVCYKWNSNDQHYEYRITA